MTRILTLSVRTPSTTSVGSWLTALAVSASMAAPAAAYADTKSECSNAYDQTQFLRKAGQLQAARAQSEMCTRSVCAEFVRNDCSTWMTEIDAALPSVIIVATDPSGAPVREVTVTVDGKAWLTKLDGTARPLDPGTHQFRYEFDGHLPIERVVVVREGEKDKRVSIQFTSPAGGAPIADRNRPVPPDTAITEPGSPSPAPLVLIGVGGGFVLLGAIFGGVVLYEKSVTDEHCSDQLQLCDADGIAAGDTGRVLGPLTTVSFAVGGVGLATGIVWAVVRSRPANAASWLFAPAIGEHEAGGTLSGVW